jgi:hypothetical protein
MLQCEEPVFKVSSPASQRRPFAEITVQGEDGNEVKAPNLAFEEWEALDQ